MQPAAIAATLTDPKRLLGTRPTYAAKTSWYRYHIQAKAPLFTRSGLRSTSLESQGDMFAFSAWSVQIVLK